MKKFLSILSITAVLGAGWTLGALGDDERPRAWPENSPHAKAIGFDGSLTCAVYAKDWEQCVKWYQDALGFQVQHELAEMKWAQLYSAVTNVTVGIGGQPEAAAEEQHASLVFGVADIDVARKALEDKGVEFLGPTEVIPELVKLAHFKDPAGNKLSLSQSLQQSPSRDPTFFPALSS